LSFLLSTTLASNLPVELGEAALMPTVTTGGILGNREQLVLRRATLLNGACAYRQMKDMSDGTQATIVSHPMRIRVAVAKTAIVAGE
jgi:2-keto-4-pentenoate hydratase